MTAVSLHLAAPTRTEGALLQLADALTAFVARRRMLRTEQRARVVEMIQQAQTRRTDPRQADHLFAQMGLPRK